MARSSHSGGTPIGRIGSTRWDLESRHSGALLRLRKRLTASTGFRLIILDFDDSVYRDKVIQYIARFPVSVGTLSLGVDIADFSAFERLLEEASRDYDVVHILNFEKWLKHPDRDQRFTGFNYHRETIAETCPSALLLWMLGHDIREFALKAPDMWAWRSDVLDFSLARPVPSPTESRQALDSGSASRAERLKRALEIEEYFRIKKRIPDRSKASLYGELGALYKDLGDWDQSLTNYEKAADFHRSLDDRRNTAFIRDELADLYFRRGDPDLALEWLSKSLEVHEQLGDVRSRAVTMGQIADILQSRGDLEEAMRIRQEEQLPVYEQLGDVRSRAVTMGQIADILQSRGDLDKAMQTLQEEVLPAFEKLGDVRSLLVARAHLGICHLKRGEPEDFQRANELLCVALTDARRLRIPEAAQIETLLSQSGMTCE